MVRSQPLLGATSLVVVVCTATCGGGVTPQVGGRLEPFIAHEPAAPPDDALAIAAIFPTVGRFAISGRQSHNGARMAARDINFRGGIHGRKIALLDYRTGSYFLDTKRAAELAASRGVLAMVGANASSLSRAVATVAESVGLVQVSNVSTVLDLTWDPATGRERPFVFRVCGSDVLMGRRLAEFARDDLRAQRVALLYEVGRTYSAQLAQSFSDHFQSPDQGRLTEEFFYLPLETDFRSQLRQIAAFAPDVIFVPGSFPDATLIATQAELLGLDPTLLGADGWSNRLLFKRGGPARPAYYADHCSVSPDFRERYLGEFAEEMDGCRAALAYDAVAAVVLALGSLGPLTEADLSSHIATTRDRLRTALRRVSVYGRAGPLRFDEHGDGVRRLAVFELERTPAGVESTLIRWLGAEP